MPSKFKRLLVLVPLVFFGTLVTHKTKVADGDEVHYLLIAESLYDDGDLWMDNQYPDAHLYMPHPSDPHVTTIMGHGTFPGHDVGLPVLMLPAMAVVHAVVPNVPESMLRRLRIQDPVKVTFKIFSYQSIILSCCIAWLLCSYLQSHFGFSTKEAVPAALFALLTPPLLTYGYHFHTELYSAFFVLVAVMSLRRASSSSPAPWLFGVALFALSWLHVKNLPLVGAFWSVWIFQSWERKSTRSLLVPSAWLILAVAGRLLLHYHYFDTPYLTVPRTDVQANPLSLRYVPRGILGMFFDRQYGLLFCAPIYWLLPAGLIFVYKARLSSWWRKEFPLVVTYVAGLSPFYCWWAGGSPSGRHLLTVVPLIWPPILLVLRSAWRSRFSWLAKGFVVTSLLVTSYIWQNPKSTWWRAPGTNVWMDAFTIQNFPWRNAFPSLLEESVTVYLQLLFWVTLFFWGGWKLSNELLSERESRGR